MGLRPQAATAAAHILQSDPHHPVPTIGGSITSGLPVFAGGAFDQREAPGFFGSAGNNLPLSARADVLVFQSEPLTEDLCVAGDVRVRLWIDSDAPDTDFTAKLVDVYPPNEDYPQGYAMNITDGIIRCRYRNSWTQPELLQPGKVVEVVIEPFATCNLFKKSTACGWTSQAATSRISTATPTAARQKAKRAANAPPPAASTSAASTPRCWNWKCCPPLR